MGDLPLYGPHHAFTVSLLPDYPRLIWFKMRLRERIDLRAFRRVSRLLRVQSPCLKLPFLGPEGPPEPLAPPCIRHRRRPLTAACRHGKPVLVLAPQRGALAIFARRRSISA